jgi:hypothetical protein
VGTAEEVVMSDHEDEGTTTDDTDAVETEEAVPEDELSESVEKFETRNLPNGEESRELVAKEDAGFVRDSTGAEHQTHGLELGAGQVQAEVDAAQESGHWPPSGPPSADHTVAAVTGNTVLQDLVDAKSDD